MRLRAFAAGCRWLGFCADGDQPVVVKRFLDAPGSGGADALVYLECPQQVPGGLAEVAVREVALADPFQGACFF